jgi:hypothetical protein
VSKGSGRVPNEKRREINVTRRIKRKFSSLTYLARKTYWKIVTAKPSLLVIAFATVSLCVFLLGGGVYDLLQKPLIGYPAGRLIFYYPRRLHDQVILESLTVMIIYAMGVAGFLLTYQSTKYAYKPRQAFMLLLTGAVLIFIAYLYIEYVLWLKIKG